MAFAPCLIIAFAAVLEQEATATVRAADATALVERIDGALGFHSAKALLCRLLEVRYRGWIAEFVVAMASLVYYGKSRPSANSPSHKC